MEFDRTEWPNLYFWGKWNMGAERKIKFDGDR